MPSRSEEFSTLKSKAKKLYSKEDMLDIVLFGSYAKAKMDPNDIDIAVIFRKKVDDDKVKRFQEEFGDNFHISAMPADNFFTSFHSLSKTLLFEGISLISGKALSSRYGLRSAAIYSYELKGEESSKKVRFVYLIRGRSGGKGIVAKLGGEFISNQSFIIPSDKDSEMLGILNHWEIKFSRKKIFLLR